MAVVSALTKQSAKDPALVNLLRCLHFYSAVYGFHFSASHVPSNDNTAADALFRQIIIDFSLFIPQIQPITIPEAVRDLLLVQRPEWTSEEWTRLFALSLAKESHPVPHDYTPPV
jgi:hypothetical protein